MLADIQAEKGEAAAQSGSATREAKRCSSPATWETASQVEALVEGTVDAYGGLDVMISNAAVLHPADILELEEEDFDRVVRVNLKGCFLTGRAAAKQMVGAGTAAA